MNGTKKGRFRQHGQWTDDTREDTPKLALVIQKEKNDKNETRRYNDRGEEQK